MRSQSFLRCERVGLLIMGIDRLTADGLTSWRNVAKSGQPDFYHRTDAMSFFYPYSYYNLGWLKKNNFITFTRANPAANTPASSD
ncbi:MAG: hypothetical protein WCG63_13160 [Opitutaceae bacterium]